MIEKDLALIIEDNEQLADIFAQAMRYAKFKTEIVNNGRLAIERLQEIVPGFILLDMHLPEASGEDVIRAIKADERLRETILFLATADAVMAESWRDEVDLVLLKPISFAQLRDLAGRLHL